MKAFPTTSRPAALAIAGKTPVCASLLGAVALLAASASPALAQQARPVHTKQTDTELWLTIDNPSLQRVQVQVMQLATGNCLSNEVNYRPSYGSKLQFEQLPAGEYAVLMRVGRERYRYAVQVQAPPQRATISVREVEGQPLGKAVASAAR